MAAPVAAIHDGTIRHYAAPIKDVDGRDKPGHDDKPLKRHDKFDPRMYDSHSPLCGRGRGAKRRG
jgi:hypothetical protein